jgi:hypothetical protein
MARNASCQGLTPFIVNNAPACESIRDSIGRSSKACRGLYFCNIQDVEQVKESKVNEFNNVP